MAVNAQRVTALVLLLLAGVLSLPASAYVLDGQGTENWILPVHLVGMTTLGAVVGRLLPGLAGVPATARRATAVGAAVGFACAIAGLVLFFVLINGIGGA